MTKINIQNLKETMLEKIQMLVAEDLKSFKLSLGKIPLLILHNKEEGKDFLLLNLRDFRKIIKIEKRLPQKDFVNDI